LAPAPAPVLGMAAALDAACGFVCAQVIGGGWWGGWGGYDGCWSYRPVYDASGVYLGYSYVYICY
jgi:hypothetical protein